MAGENRRSGRNPGGDAVRISPDALIFWQWGPLTLNATIVFTWLVMGLLVTGSWLVTRGLRANGPIPRWQNLLESIVLGMRSQFLRICPREADRSLPFVGTIFLFVAAANLLAVVPYFEPPTGSLSTTAALAVCVALAVPYYGIASRGAREHFRQYLKPTVFMLPFNMLGEVSRTLALAVRLFGNIMSGSMVAAILLAVTPFLFPVVLQILGLLTGMVQAYIFAVLAAVFIAAGCRGRQLRGNQSCAARQEGD